MPRVLIRKNPEIRVDTQAPPPRRPGRRQYPKPEEGQVRRPSTMMCAARCVAAAAAVPALQARALPRRGGGGGPVGRLRRRGEAVLLPPPRAGRRGETLEDWCAAHGRQDLLEEWDDPSKGTHEVTRGSKAKVWWKCGKEGCGHRWGAQVKNRVTLGTGCPACAGRVPTATHNFEVYCQETGREELLGQWADRSRRPKDFMPASRAKVPWQCGECGWGWQSTINNRTSSSRPRGCPACAGKVPTATHNFEVYCQETGREELLGEWADRSRRPKDFTPGSGVKVPWECRECGWGWEALISSRTYSSHPSGCPSCAGRVVTPTNNFAVWCGKNGRADLLGEWAHPDKAPTDFTPATGVKVPWKCGECGWGWETRVSDRTRSSCPSGCPNCNPGGGGRGGRTAT